jgi:hypothetical protein
MGWARRNLAADVDAGRTAIPARIATRIADSNARVRNVIAIAWQRHQQDMSRGYGLVADAR